MPENLERLDAHTESKHLRIVVESPRGSRVKYEYSPETGAFHVKRPLPAGLAYPFDWGFIPGTQAADGDPVDVMLVSDHVSYPGTLVEGRTLAILHVMERPKRGDVEDNPRIIAVPEWVDASLGEAMLAPLRDDIRDFLVRVGETAEKEILDAQWGPAKEADAFIAGHRQRARK